VTSIDELAGVLEAADTSNSVELGVVRGVDEITIAVDLGTPSK